MLMLCCLYATTALADKLTNNSIIELHKLGLGESVIAEKIRLTPNEFDTSVDGLKRLKEAGIPDGLIAEMLRASAPKTDGSTASAPPVVAGDPNDPAAPHESGIYYYSTDPSGAGKMTQVEASIFTQTKANVALFAAYGQQSKTRGFLSGAHAQIQTNQRQPEFYFYFDRTTASLSSGSTERTSPAEFSLVAMDVKEKKAERSMIFARAGLYAGVNSGPDQKVLRPFESTRIGAGTFKVMPKAGLADGEYCFLYSGATPPVGFGVSLVAAGGNVPLKAFCFGVQSSEPPPSK